MAKILSPSALLIRATIAWIRTGTRQAVTAPAGQGALRLCLQWLPPLASPRVVVLFPSVLEKTSASSHRLSGHARRPCRTGGGGVIFAGRSGGVCSSSSRKDLGTRLRFLRLLCLW